MKPPAHMTARTPGHFIGVDLGRMNITAGVFTDTLQFVGKFKRSTKAERGADAVLDRIARCVREAADECDLPLEGITGVGLGLAGTVDAHTGLVLNAAQLGWENVPLRSELGKRLKIPVHLENTHHLGALAIYDQELKSQPRTFAAIFWGTSLGGGWLGEGRIHTDLEAKSFSSLIAEGQRETLHLLPAALRDLRGRDLRKGLRRGDKIITAFVRAAAEVAGSVAARVIERFAPDVLALGGGVMEEMRDEWMTIIESVVQKRIPQGQPNRTKLVPSSLGGNAGLCGGAALAARHRRETENSSTPTRAWGSAPPHGPGHGLSSSG